MALSGIGGFCSEANGCVGAPGGFPGPGRHSCFLPITLTKAAVGPAQRDPFCTAQDPAIPLCDAAPRTVAARPPSWPSADQVETTCDDVNYQRFCIYICMYVLWGNTNPLLSCSRTSTQGIQMAPSLREMVGGEALPFSMTLHTCLALGWPSPI